jgi:hypothetical protein
MWEVFDAYIRKNCQVKKIEQETSQEWGKRKIAPTLRSQDEGHPESFFVGPAV